MKKGQLDRAIDDFSRTISIDPKNSVAYYKRGDTYAKKGQYDRAIDDFSSAIFIDPKNTDAYFMRGVAYAVTGNIKNMNSNFQKACNLGHERSCELLSPIESEESNL